MTGEGAERFVVFNLRLLAGSPSRSSACSSSASPTAPWARSTTSATGCRWARSPLRPRPQQQLWLALGFAYMTVITGICLVVSTDVVRYRPLLLVLAAGKAASSLTALGFYLFDADVFAYLLNFLVDGFLVGVALLLWSLAGRVGDPAAAF